MTRKIVFFLIVAVVLAGIVIALSLLKSRQSASSDGKLVVVTTIFPLYDFARQVGGRYVDVTMLLLPATEPHSFSPRPSDIMKVAKADVFIYIGPEMEPWAEDIISGVDNANLRAIRADEGITLLAVQDEKSEHNIEDITAEALSHNTGMSPDTEYEGYVHNHEGQNDPHIWLDFDNAKHIVDKITNTFVALDPQNKDYYEQNSRLYKDKLTALDQRYKEELDNRRLSVFITAGHSAFAYLAKRYGLIEIAVHGVSPNAQPSAKRVTELITLTKQQQVDCIFFEQLIDPRVAEIIAKEIDAKTLPLYSTGNISKAQWNSDVTFVSLMEQNLENLKKGLGCE